MVDIRRSRFYHDAMFLKVRDIRWLWVAALTAALTAAAPAGAQIARLSGTLEYTGAFGPVNAQRPLCLCVYYDPDLTRLAGCFFYDTARTSYRINTFDTRDYFVIAFLDIHVNETPDPDEPFEIFRDRGARPGDAATSGVDVDGIDLIFGDEHLPGVVPTATETGAATPTPSPSATPTATSTPTQTTGSCAGDCDGSGAVSMSELITLLDDALAGRVPPICGRSTDGQILVETLVGAARSAESGCH